MEMHTLTSTDFTRQAEALNFTVLINNCCAEFSNWTWYMGIPRYDPALAAALSPSPHQLHLCFTFDQAGTTVYVPVRYRSLTGRHLFDFPVLARDTQTDAVRVLNAAGFLELVIAFARLTDPEVQPADIPERLEHSIANIAVFLAHFQSHGLQPNRAELSFLAAEQLLALGHNTHALTKGRQGFSPADLLRYSPETGAAFSLHYFLLHPDTVLEKSADRELPSVTVRAQLLAGGTADRKLLDALDLQPGWKVVPVHPWEAAFLLRQPAVQEMQQAGLLTDLGPAGPEFFATSSVRTVYCAESPLMYKLSLHVKITSAERINYLHEMYRGYDLAQLMQTSWGKELREALPTIHFITDPAFIAVSFRGKLIDGFSTSFRENPFTAEEAVKNTGLLASLCQDGLNGAPSRLQQLMGTAAARSGRDIRETAVAWFSKYLDLILLPSVRLFSRFGMACEAHQQNVLIAFDDHCFPEKVYFRDNQGFLFRESCREELTALLPGLGLHSKAFIPDERLFPILSHYLLISNLFGLINAMGCSGLADEAELLRLVDAQLQQAEQDDPSGLVAYLRHSRNFPEKANLLTSLRQIDGAGNPAGVVRRPYPNLLQERFFSEKLLCPELQRTLFSRYFPKEAVTITIRAFDIDRDLEMVHEWFNREHALKIWQMNWPLRQLEQYYRTQLPGRVMYSYIGEANGEPTFNFEVYWATRDMLGDYYEVLPSDYGTHQFIAPTDPKKKYASPSTRAMLDYVFAEPKVGKMVGEGAVDSMASIMNKAHVGFRIEKVIELPHKKANLNFCYREWYQAKFPETLTTVST